MKTSELFENSDDYALHNVRTRRLMRAGLAARLDIPISYVVIRLFDEHPTEETSTIRLYVDVPSLYSASDSKLSFFSRMVEAAVKHIISDLDDTAIIELPSEMHLGHEVAKSRDMVVVSVTIKPEGT